MTNEEKARYEELDAKDCLIDCEDIIDYYSLRCEILEERLEHLENENQELKERQKDILNANVELSFDNYKHKKAIEWLKENLNFKIEKHKSSPNCMFVSYKDLQEWLEPSNEIVYLLEEVLRNEKDK